MDLKKLGSRIRELRIKKGLTQEALSEESGMNGKHFGEVERGIINISIQKLDRVAVSLGVSLTDLLEAGHQKPKEELMRDVVIMMNNAEYDQVQIIHRLVKVIVL